MDIKYIPKMNYTCTYLYIQLHTNTYWNWPLHTHIYHRAKKHAKYVHDVVARIGTTVCIRYVLVRMKSLYVQTIYIVYTIYVHKNHNGMYLVHTFGREPVGQASTYLVCFWYVKGTYFANTYPIRTKICARLTYGFGPKIMYQMHAIMVFVYIDGIYNVYILYV